MTDEHGATLAPASGPLVFRHDLPDSFGRYHDLVGASGASTTRIGGTFEATVAAYNAPGVMMFDRQIVGVESRRDLSHIHRDGFEHYYLQVLRSGMLMTGPPGEERWLASGDAVLMDAALPQRTVVVAADYVTVVLARSFVEAAVPGAQMLHGRRIPREGSQGLGDAVLSLMRGAPALDAWAMAGSAGMVAGHLARFAGRADPLDEAGENASNRLRAVLFIEAHLVRPGLDVGAIVAGVGMSRSVLYRAFETVGGVEREIGRRRVARFRSALMRPGEFRSTERLALAHGFRSPSHCSRMFKATYGLTPGAYRAGLREKHRTNAGLQLDHMRSWYGEISAGA